MTKCHYVIALAVIAVLAVSCKEKKEETGLPIAYYGFQERIKSQKTYLFDPNSPYRDEEAYIPILQEILDSPYADSTQKAEATRVLPMISINRPGQTATDFEFTTRTGRQRTLLSVESEGKPILLFFSNPGCQNCKEITDALRGNNTFTVVNIYPDDDFDTWMGYVVNYPKEWISGIAPQVDNYEEGDVPLYWLRAIPSLYLLDSEKKVIMKDAPLERILEYVETNGK